MMDQILSFFVTNAYADTAPVAAPQGGGTLFMLMFAVFFVFMYFAVWRPQNRRASEQRNLLASLAKGDEVITSGGLMGRISKVTEQYIGLALNDNVEIMMQKSAVVSVLPKGTLKSIV
jgi:preprotein translocase subunit YajC